MIDTQSGAYTKTGAYNFLKDLLGVSKKTMINKKFFNLFFTESEGFYFIKKSEKAVKKMFIENDVLELNKMYYLIKMEKQPVKAKKIAQQLFNSIASSMR